MHLEPIELNRRTVSEIAGSISIACWVVVFAPQIYENFRRKSSDGLSLMFIILWLIGDIFNIVGAIMQNLLPTMIILAAYYTVADIILWFQCIWYNKNNANKKPSLNRTNNTTHINSTTIQSKITSNSENDTYDGDIVENTTECEPMLTGDSIEHHSSAMRRHADTPTKTPEMEDIESRTTKAKKKENYINDLFIVTVVMFAGFLSWYISYCNNTDSRKSPKTPPSLGDSEKMNILAQIFGYLSAVLYLGSRIPQILLNFKRKSCEGVSLLFFLFACLGNINFILSVLAVSVSKKYLLVNASWLIGSAGTLLLDMTIFAQFFIYTHSKDS